MKTLKILFVAVILASFAFVGKSNAQVSSSDTDSLIWIEKSKKSHPHPIDEFISAGKQAGYFREGKMAHDGEFKSFVLADPPAYFLFKMKKAKGIVDDIRSAWSSAKTLGKVGTKLERFQQIMKRTYPVLENNNIVNLGSELAQYYFDLGDHELLIIRTYIPKFFLDAVHFSNTGGDDDFTAPFDEKGGEKVFFVPNGKIPEARIDYKDMENSNHVENIVVKDVDLSILFSRQDLSIFLSKQSPFKDQNGCMDAEFSFRLWNDGNLGVGDNNVSVPLFRK
jgi:hypothetical protein